MMLRRLRKLSKNWGRRVGLVPPLADRGYMICSNPRSGSTYFCQLLTSTGVLGRPREYLNTAGQRMHEKPDYPANPKQQIEIIRTLGATSNGIYGVKAQEPQLRKANIRVDVMRALPNLRIVQLDRRDVLAQAISLTRARQTKKFYSEHAAFAEPSYDAAMIRHCIVGLRNQRARWDRVITDLGVTALIFDYEDIVDAPQRCVDQVADLMGIGTVKIDPSHVRSGIMRDAQSAEWRARFLAETGDALHELGVS